MEAKDILGIAIAFAGAIVTSFVAGSAIFFRIGKELGESRGAATIRDLRQTITNLVASARTTTDENNDLKTEILAIREQKNPTPDKATTDGLSKLLEKRDQELWVSLPSHRPASADELLSDSKTKILSIVNLKGGVGKTTLSANLAGYFDGVEKKRVLLIDADYQGSLSDIMRRSAGISLKDSSATIDEWLSPATDPDILLRTANRAGGDFKSTKFVSAFYSLAAIETQLMVSWLVQNSRGESPFDLRYALSRILLSPSAMNQFDVVIIDCPPRLSTATVNALCASTHFLVPTIPDKGSLEAVPNFTDMVSKLASGLNPSLKLAGVLPTMTTQHTLTAREKDDIDEMSSDARYLDQVPYIFAKTIPHKAPIATLSGESVAIFDGAPAIRSIFERLGAEISQRIGL